MNKRRIRAKALLTALLLGLLCFRGFAAPITAPMQSPLEVTIPLENTVTGNPDSHLTYVFLLDPEASAPLPGNAGQITMVGPGSGQFGPILFTKPGEYRYIAYQQQQQAEYYTLDKTKYEVLIYIESTNENGLIPTVVINKFGDSEKSNKLQFVNKYKKPDGPLPQTGLVWWPAYALAGAGVLTIILGVFLVRRKKNG